MVGILRLKTGLCMESDDDSETLPPGSAVKLCEELFSGKARPLGCASQGSSEPFAQLCLKVPPQHCPTGSPLPVGNLPGALQTSPVSAVPLLKDKG